MGNLEKITNVILIFCFVLRNPSMEMYIKPIFSEPVKSTNIFFKNESIRIAENQWEKKNRSKAR